MAANLLNTSQVAAILGIKPNTAEIWRLQGKGPKFYKIGRLVKYSSSDLDEYLRAQQRGSTSDVQP